VEVLVGLPQQFGGLIDGDAEPASQRPSLSHACLYGLGHYSGGVGLPAALARNPG
jgi:hypothetical protein